MDVGSLASTRWSLIDPHILEDSSALAKRLTIGHRRALAAKVARSHIQQQLRQASHVFTCAINHGRASVMNVKSHNVTSLLTTAHLLDRYILLLTRDCIHLESLLRQQPVPTSFWQTWQASVHELSQRIPNVHDYYMWQMNLVDPENDELDHDLAPPRCSL